MPKIDSIDKIKAVSKLAEVPGGTSFLNGVSSVVDKVNNTLTLMQKAGLLPSQPPAPATPPPVSVDKTRPELPQKPVTPPPDPRQQATNMLKAALDYAIESGIGDKPIKELLEVAAPFTIKQVRGLLK